MSEGKTFTSKTVLLSLFKEGNRIKEETSAIGGKFGERVRNQVENGRLHSGAFSKAISIYRKSRNNEMDALDQIDHLRFYLDVIESEIRDKGHTGNLDDMAGKPSISQVVSGLEPDEAPAPDALTPKEAVKKLRAARDKNPPPSPAEVAVQQDEAAAKRRGRAPKLSVVSSSDEAPPAPPSALPADDEFEAAAPTPPAPPSSAALSA